MVKQLEGFDCYDCGVDTHEIQEYFSVHDVIWDHVAWEDPSIILCIGCTEDRLMRELNEFDFMDAPVNQGCFGMSERMRNRTGHVGPIRV